MQLFFFSIINVSEGDVCVIACQYPPRVRGHAINALSGCVPLHCCLLMRLNSSIILLYSS